MFGEVGDPQFEWCGVAASGGGGDMGDFGVVPGLVDGGAELGDEVGGSGVDAGFGASGALGVVAQVAAAGGAAVLA